MLSFCKSAAVVVIGVVRGHSAIHLLIQQPIVRIMTIGCGHVIDRLGLAIPHMIVDIVRNLAAADSITDHFIRQSIQIILGIRRSIATSP